MAGSGKTDQVSLFGFLVGAASLALGFLQVRTNRIAKGVPSPLWHAAPPLAVAVLLALLAAALLLALRRRVLRPGPPGSLITALLLGIVGDLMIVADFTAAGLSAGRLMPPGIPYARVALAPGSWLYALSGYVLVLAAFEELPSRRAVRAAIGLLAPVLLAAAGAAGLFDHLSIIQEWRARADRFLAQLGYHLALALSVTTVAAIIGVPLGVRAHRRKGSRKTIFGIVGGLQTIPSLALFGLLIAPLSSLSHAVPALQDLGIRGIGTAPAFIALTLYALLPMVRNTHAGLVVVEPAMVEAGRGMGMAKSQLFFSVELPLALPVVMTGIRISLVQAIGNATVAALIGAGGLGVLIFQGLGEGAPDLVLLGTLPVIALAVTADRATAALARVVTPRGLLLASGTGAGP
jgi:osmoprotectant transport system permease protein